MVENKDKNNMRINFGSRCETHRYRDVELDVEYGN